METTTTTETACNSSVTAELAEVLKYLPLEIRPLRDLVYGRDIDPYLAKALLGLLEEFNGGQCRMKIEAQWSPNSPLVGFLPKEVTLWRVRIVVEERDTFTYYEETGTDYDAYDRCRKVWEFRAVAVPTGGYCFHEEVRVAFSYVSLGDTEEAYLNW